MKLNTFISFYFLLETDTQPPVVTCPADITQTTGPGVPSAFVTWTTSATDNVGVTSESSNFNSGQVFFVGTREIEYTASDAEGNSASCSFNVTVVGGYFTYMYLD